MPTSKILDYRDDAQNSRTDTQAEENNNPATPVLSQLEFSKDDEHGHV